MAVWPPSAHTCFGLRRSIDSASASVAKVTSIAQARWAPVGGYEGAVAPAPQTCLSSLESLHAGSEPDDGPGQVAQAPATRPLSPATSIASFVDTVRVRLLSMAQHRQAPRMNSAPVEKVASAGSHDSRTPPATMATMPRTIWWSVFSLNTSQARCAFSPPAQSQQDAQPQTTAQVEQSGQQQRGGVATGF